MFKWIEKILKPQDEGDPRLTDEDRTNKKSNQPWVTILGESIDEEKGLRIEMDWNDAFIKYLRQNGYTGANDDAVVSNWLAQLYRHLISQMDTKETGKYE